MLGEIFISIFYGIFLLAGFVLWLLSTMVTLVGSALLLLLVFLLSGKVELNANEKSLTIRYRSSRQKKDDSEVK